MASMFHHPASVDVSPPAEPSAPGASSSQKKRNSRRNKNKDRTSNDKDDGPEMISGENKNFDVAQNGADQTDTARSQAQPGTQQGAMSKRHDNRKTTKNSQTQHGPSHVAPASLEPAAAAMAAVHSQKDDSTPRPLFMKEQLRRADDTNQRNGEHTVDMTPQKQQKGQQKGKSQRQDRTSQQLFEPMLDSPAGASNKSTPKCNEGLSSIATVNTDTDPNTNNTDNGDNIENNTGNNKKKNKKKNKNKNGQDKEPTAAVLDNKSEEATKTTDSVAGNPAVEVDSSIKGKKTKAKKGKNKDPVITVLTNADTETTKVAGNNTTTDPTVESVPSTKQTKAKSKKIITKEVSPKETVIPITADKDVDTAVMEGTSSTQKGKSKKNLAPKTDSRFSNMDTETSATADDATANPEVKRTSTTPKTKGAATKGFAPKEDNTVPDGIDIEAATSPTIDNSSSAKKKKNKTKKNLSPKNDGSDFNNTDARASTTSNATTSSTLDNTPPARKGEKARNSLTSKDNSSHSNNNVDAETNITTESITINSSVEGAPIKKSKGKAGKDIISEEGYTQEGISGPSQKFDDTHQDGPQDKGEKKKKKRNKKKSSEGTADNQDDSGSTHRDFTKDISKSQQPSKDERRSPISPSNSFAASSSLASSGVTTSEPSSASRPSTQLAPGFFSIGNASTRTSEGKKTREEMVTAINTDVSRDKPSPLSAPSISDLGSTFTSLTSSMPSNRRSSLVVPSGDNHGRSASLATVEESMPEKHPQATDQAAASAPKRGHSRSLSMVEQLTQLPQGGREGRSIESIQEIIQSLKNIPAGQGHPRQERRSSLSFRNSIGPLNGPPTSTVLHISQPPSGTDIADAVQSTLTTLRRLSVSDTKRPLIPLREDEETANGSHEKSDGTCSSTSSKNTTINGNSAKNNRASTTSHKPPVSSFPSDDEDDDVADALSTLEGKGPQSNRSKSSAKGARQQSRMNPNSLEEFTAGLPSHIKSGAKAASTMNSDIGKQHHRYTASPHVSVNGSGPANAKATPAGPPRADDTSSKETSKSRRSLFTPHFTYSEFHTLMTKNRHRYVQGVIRINRRNRSEAYATVDVLPDGDVFISGSRDRNRALEGETVGIELFDPENLPSSVIESLKDKKRDRQIEGLDDNDDGDEESKPKYFGRVVAIVERSPQIYSGTLILQRPNPTAKKTEQKKRKDNKSDQPKIVWFKPTDKRIPLIAIPVDKAPADFVENRDYYARRLFASSIKRWPVSSLHPFGVLEKELGDIGNINVETEALLMDNNVATGPFGYKVEQCLPKLPWTIPDDEMKRRRDIRKDCVFSIDPATAKDLDDAVSCVPLKDGTFEIGVHIADVSHFIQVGSALDKEAKSRSTTVYLVQKAIPMLPNVLCEDLCSLKGNVDRLAFSVFWKMTDKGDVLDTSFSKTVIRSCAQLSYEDAQNVITTGSLKSKTKIVGHSRVRVEKSIKTLFKISQILRQRRFDNGALSINSVKLTFDLDEQGNPLDMSVYETKESNRLIEEFMLLANMSVAKQIYEAFPEQALLRRHEPPHAKGLATFVSQMEQLGLDMDASSSGALQRSLDGIQDPGTQEVVRALAVKPMQRSRYISSGMMTPEMYHHYALNVPLYTHFTSPIRRYPDVVTHRMLEASLTDGSKLNLTKEACHKITSHCNTKKDAAKDAQERSTLVYLSVMLKKLTESKGVITKDALVVNVLDEAFDVYIQEYGLVARVYVDRLPLERHVWNKSTETLKLYWSTEPSKNVTDDEDPANSKVVEKNDRVSASKESQKTGGLATDHPEDTTNASEDECQLSDDDSEFDDDDGDDDDDDDGGKDDEAARTSSGASDAQDDEDDEGDDKAHRMTRIRIFAPLKVMVTSSTGVSPPLIKAVAMNPFAVCRSQANGSNESTIG
ncbi:hypothetical protein BGX31_003124 [Mortierella sp. GBA43]|nr:hypothetical protein BGX31_003124 [Mortierella sp. GBA43]